MRFDEMGLSPQLMKALQAMGFEQATPIQEQAIPLLRQGEDVLGQAQTGTGKTASFGLPILERYLQEKPNATGAHKPGRAMPMALVLVPTRELAVQVCDEVSRMGQFTGARIVPVYGGESIERQIRSFYHRVDIVVGTPGRVLDHIDRGTLELAGVHVAVLDEADRMLDMGFVRAIVQIMGCIPATRQTVLFSATMPREMMTIAHRYMKSPQTVKVSEDRLTVDKIKQYYIVVDAANRLPLLMGLLKLKQPKLAMIFTRTKHGADKLMRILRDRGFAAAALHGNLKQSHRDRAMRDFREGRLHIMVATDLASRGLDVEDVSHVINYDVPDDPMSYVHRIGRTGRMGADGEAVTFVMRDQRRELEDIMAKTKAPMELLRVEPDHSHPAPVSPPMGVGRGEHERSPSRDGRRHERMRKVHHRRRSRYGGEGGARGERGEQGSGEGRSHGGGYGRPREGRGHYGDRNGRDGGDRGSGGHRPPRHGPGEGGHPVRERRRF